MISLQLDAAICESAAGAELCFELLEQSRQVGRVGAKADDDRDQLFAPAAFSTDSSRLVLRQEDLTVLMARTYAFCDGLAASFASHGAFQRSSVE